MRQRIESVIVIVGPTAVGKTAFSLRLARRLNGEIISADSMAVYRGMDIATQKPSLADRRKVRHHLIDIISPAEEFSAASFRRRAIRAISAICKKGKVPIIVGGTGLYVKALIDGLFPSPPKDEALRKRLYRLAHREGSAKLYSMLEYHDLETAANIHPNDTKRIIRALEICHTTKKTVSEIKARTHPLSDSYHVRIIGLTRPREELYPIINERVDRMFEAGLLEEVRGLARRKLSITASQAIGYKETFSYIKRFRGAIDEDEIEALKELIKRNSRRYAKRQMTWFGADKRVEWFDLSSVRETEVIRKVIRLLGNGKGNEARIGKG
jgi:tRNA dimethylallyltransferase